MTAATAQRYHALDAARGILMMLGILVHAANVYTPDSAWIVADPPGNPFFGLLSDAIHVFRMPAFFWISGFFAAMTYSRSGRSELLRTRVPRIGIPLIVTWFTLNPAQDWLVHQASGPVAASSSFALPDLYHLWFLVDLLLFMLVAVLVLPWFGKRMGAPGGWPALPAFMVLMVLIAYGGELVVRATGVAYDSILGLTSLYRLAEHFPYFLGGMILYLRRELLTQAFGMPWFAFPMALGIALVTDPLTNGPATWITESARLLQIGSTWLCVFALLSAFGLFFSRSSAFTTMVSDSAYSVYLFHHIVVVATAMVLTAWDAAPWIKFVLVCACATLTALFVHVALVRRHSWVRLLFNGKH